MQVDAPLPAGRSQSNVALPGGAATFLALGAVPLLFKVLLVASFASVLG